MRHDPVTQQIKESYSKRTARKNNFVLDDINRESESMLSDIILWLRHHTVDYAGNPSTYNKNRRRTFAGLGASAVSYFISPPLSVPVLLYTATKAYQAHKDKQSGGRSIC
jgi:hypothetical protein